MKTMSKILGTIAFSCFGLGMACLFPVIWGAEIPIVFQCMLTTLTIGGMAVPVAAVVDFWDEEDKNATDDE